MVNRFHRFLLFVIYTKTMRFYYFSHNLILMKSIKYNLKSKNIHCIRFVSVIHSLRNILHTLLFNIIFLFFLFLPMKFCVSRLWREHLLFLVPSFYFIFALDMTTHGVVIREHSITATKYAKTRIHVRF